MLVDSRAHDRVLGDGPDPAPARGRHDPRDHQPAAAARHDRQARRGRVPGARALQRAGRPHDGHLGEDARGVPRRAGRRVRHRQPARARRTTPSTRSGRCATAAPRCSSAMGGNFVSATPDTDGHRGRAAQLRADGAGVDEAQPQPRGARRDRADPADARAAPTRHPGRRQTAGHGRGFDVDGAPVARQPQARRATSCAARSRSSANWRATLLGADHPVPWETFDDDYDRIRDAIAARGARLRGLQHPGPRSPTASSCRTRPRDSREFPTSTGKANFAVEPAGVGAGAAGPADAADAAQPRPVQHHDLRPRRPLPRRQGRPPGGVRQPRRHRRRSGFATATGSTWCPSSPATASCRSVGPRTSWWCRTRPRSAMPRPTTRRPTRWCRWITSPARSNTPVSKAVVIRLEHGGC